MNRSSLLNLGILFGLLLLPAGCTVGVSGYHGYPSGSYWGSYPAYRSGVRVHSGYRYDTRRNHAHRHSIGRPSHLPAKGRHRARPKARSRRR